MMNNLEESYDQWSDAFFDQLDAINYVPYDGEMLHPASFRND